MAFQAAFMGPTWAPSSTLAMKEGRQMKSEDVIVKSEGTLHTSPFLITRLVLLMVLWVTVGITEYTVYVFGQVILRMLCWVYIVDGVQAGPAWAPSSEESLK